MVGQETKDGQRSQLRLRWHFTSKEELQLFFAVSLSAFLAGAGRVEIEPNTSGVSASSRCGRSRSNFFDLSLASNSWNSRSILLCSSRSRGSKRWQRWVAPIATHCRRIRWCAWTHWREPHSSHHGRHVRWRQQRWWPRSIGRRWHGTLQVRL